MAGRSIAALYDCRFRRDPVAKVVVGKRHRIEPLLVILSFELVVRRAGGYPLAMPSPPICCEDFSFNEGYERR
jgi:hypothetical protein